MVDCFRAASEELRRWLIALEVPHIWWIVWKDVWFWCHLGEASGKLYLCYALEFSTYDCDNTLEEYGDGIESGHYYC